MLDPLDVRTSCVEQNWRKKGGGREGGTYDRTYNGREYPHASNTLRYRARVVSVLSGAILRFASEQKSNFEANLTTAMRSADVLARSVPLQAPPEAKADAISVCLGLPVLHLLYVIRVPSPAPPPVFLGPSGQWSKR